MVHISLLGQARPTIFCCSAWLGLNFVLVATVCKGYAQQKSDRVKGLACEIHQQCLTR